MITVKQMWCLHEDVIKEIHIAECPKEWSEYYQNWNYNDEKWCALKVAARRRPTHWALKDDVDSQRPDEMDKGKKERKCSLDFLREEIRNLTWALGD